MKNKEKRSRGKETGAVGQLYESKQHPTVTQVIM